MAGRKEISLDEINGDAFIGRLKANDSDAFDDLFDCLIPKLCSFLSGDFKLSEQDGNEIAADTMFKVNKSVAKFNPRGGAKLTTWIFRIAENGAIDLLRQRKKQAENFRQNISIDDSVSREIAQNTAKRWFRQNASDDKSGQPKPSPELARINKALEALSEQDRSILLMKQNMEYEEIAAAENASVPALRTRYSRAFERLRHELRKEESL